MFVKAKEFVYDAEEENGENEQSWSEAKLSTPQKVSSVLRNQGSNLVATDINNDGYPDVIDGKNGLTLISLPDGRYYGANLTGEISVCDLNADGVKDMVVFDKENSVVLLELSQPDGSYKETQLISNGSITAIYCHDLDGDGIVDIMLQAATTEYAYLLFFKNKGDGTFKKTERALKGEYQLSKPCEFYMNGKPTVFAMKKGDYLDGYEAFNYVKTIAWDSQFNITEDSITVEDDYGVMPLVMPWSSDVFDYIADYDGDGLLDLFIVDPISNAVPINYYNYPYLYSSAGSNTAPLRMAAPNVVYDKASSCVKIEWKEGKDKESASGDLTYELKAVADGTTLMLYDAGSSLQYIANAGLWSQNQIELSVRAVDPNGLKGEWSPTATFTNDMPSAEFTLSERVVYATDTLSVFSVSGQDLEYSFIPDGHLLSQENGVAKIVFDDFGTKTILATLNGSTYQQNISVLPLQMHQLGYNHRQVFDLNMDGKTESIYKGINIWNDNTKTYETMPTLFNSDFSSTDVYAFLDKNMNGLPDMVGSFRKNGTEYNWLVNNGDLDFNVVTDESTPSFYGGDNVDINNDGLAEVNLTAIVDGEEKKVRFSVYTIADFDRDGYLDILEDNNILHNQGNNTFVTIPVVVWPESISSISGTTETSISDVNNDGYLDIVCWLRNYRDSYNDRKRIILLGGKNMTFNERIEWTTSPISVDIDNDGLTDFAGEWSDGSGYLVELTRNGERIPLDASIDLSPWQQNRNGYHFIDINNDGKPDWTGLYSINSPYTNTAPTAPTSVIVNQEGSEVVVSWSGATDKETPAVALRYNLSVKEKGAEGDNSYIISPLNGTRDEAKTIDTGNHQYRYATRFPIPSSRFKAGKTYEVQVQTIDGWCEHSPFSKVVEFKAAAQALISLPEKGGVGMAIPFTYSDNTGATPTINAGDGTVSGQTITWSTPGVKTVTVTAGSVRNTRQILIVDTPDLGMTIPAKALTGTTITVDLPEAFRTANGKATLEDNNDILVDVLPNGETATLIIPAAAGRHQLTAAYEDDVFGRLTKTYAVEVVDFTPELSLITVENGKNRLNWDKNMLLPDASLFTGKVNIYRETSISDNYEVIGQVNISDGGFTDADSRPDVKSDRYMITLGTAYGTETAPSAVHGTVHLMLNKGVGNAINLHWTAYQGADIAQYAIMAGTSPSNLSEIATVSGNARSYTHQRTSSATTYYAVAYRLRGDVAAAKSKRRASEVAENPGASNVISSDEAYHVTMVTGIAIGSVEEDMELNESQTELHLTAYVTPALATLTTVEWSIVDGDAFASVDRDGTVHIKENTTGGFVTVQAKAIDGSGVVETVEIPVGVYTHIATVGAGNSVTIRGMQHAIRIEGITTDTEILVVNLQSQVVHRSVSRGDRLITNLPAGIYIVKVGKTVKKVVVK